MIAPNGIRVQNIYYMLAYAWQALLEGEYARVKDEEFDDADDLFGEILAIGMSGLVKRGICRNYVEREDDIRGVRGRIELTGTFRNVAARRQLVSCRYDEFSVDNLLNRILKTTAMRLMRIGKLKKSKTKLKRVLEFFFEVEEIRDLRLIRWDEVRYQRNNRHYLLLLNICRFVIEGLLMDDGKTSGERQIRHVRFDEDRFNKLYESFIRGYYQRWYAELRPEAPHIRWSVDGDCEGRNVDQLPAMRSDVTLTHETAKLIIDAKFYKKSVQEYYGNVSVNSANVYQIFAYVKNEQANDSARKVSGMLLYAKTDEEAQPDLYVQILGNRIAARTLDLSKPFDEIARQLDGIASEYFGVKNVYDQVACHNKRS